MVFKSIREILNGRRFASIAPEAALETASDLMLEEGTSALPVVTAGDLVGIITERDILRHVSQQGGYATTPVSSAMTRDVVCVETRGSILHALMCMQEGGFGHLPVLDMGGKVVGLLTRDDIPEEYKTMRGRSSAWRAGLAAK